MKTADFDQSIRQKWLHLATLFTIAVAHPLLDLTSRNPAFFVARKSGPLEILLVVFTLCFLIPSFFIFIEWAMGHRKMAGRIFHGIIFFLLCTAIALPALKKTTALASEWIILGTILIGASLTVAYFRFANARSAITFLCPALIIVPVLFLNNPRINRIVRPSHYGVGKVSIQAKYPVVMVVLDELPLKSLLDTNGDIDAGRYPNFYELSRTATWYRNATTVAGDTIQAIPAILTGNYPKPSLLPNRTDHPRNLVSLLEGQYEMRVDEFITGFSLQKRRKKREPITEKMTLLFADLSAIYLHHVLPPNQIKRLPVITQTWGHFWNQQQQLQPGSSQRASTIDQRARKFRRFVASITKSSKPCFYFIHSMLPHVPWQYFPSGKQYNPDGIGYFGVDGLTKYETWIKDPIIRELSFKRHLMQVAFVDQLLGELIRKLKREKLWDQSVFIILSDHGTSFLEGKRRAITGVNFQDIMRVPLFIKMPLQTNGEISGINAQIIDILPTIQSILKIDCDWKSDGRSLLNAFDRPRLKTFVFHTKTLQFPFDSQPLKGFEQTDPVKIAIAVHPEWLGTNLNQFQYQGASPIEVHLHNSDTFRDVNIDSGFIPALITAHIQDQNIEETAVFGIVVDGVLRATTRAFQFGHQTQFLSSVVPESSFQNGANHVEIILFSENGKKEFLRPRMIHEKGQPSFDYSGKSL